MDIIIILIFLEFRLTLYTWLGDEFKKKTKDY